MVSFGSTSQKTKHSFYFLFTLVTTFSLKYFVFADPQGGIKLLQKCFWGNCHKNLGWWIEENFPPTFKILIHFWKTIVISSLIFFFFLLLYSPATSSPFLLSHLPVRVSAPDDTYGHWLALRSVGPLQSHPGAQADISWLLCPITQIPRSLESNRKLCFCNRNPFFSKPQ